MTLDNFDYSDFTERDDLISYKSLFAAEAPGLRGKMKLCEELQDLDREEYEVVCLEQAVLKGLKGGDSKSTLASLILPLVGLAMSVCMLVYGIFQQSVLLTLLPVPFLSIDSAVISEILNPNSPEELQKIGQIFDNRLSRMNTKLRKINQKISTHKDPETQEQLQLARDYFSTKYDIYTRVRIKDFIPALV